MLDSKRDTARRPRRGEGTDSPGNRQRDVESSSRLAQVLARYCRGRTVACTCEPGELEGALERRHRQVFELDLKRCGDVSAARPPIWTEKLQGRKSTESPGVFDTILAMGSLERMSENERTPFLQDLWERLSPDGRLIVCVPNENCGGDTDDEHSFNRRRLRRQLKTLGTPRLVKEQPFKWLVLYVDKNPVVSGSVRERYRIIADLCKGAVIELGCGPGELSRTIAERGLSVVGVDKNSEKIEQARRRYPDIEFIDANILSLSLSDKSFDTVVLSEVLEHVPEEAGDQMLSTAWGFVASGGRLVVSVPNEDCVPHPNHLREFDQKSLTRLLGQFGRPFLVTEQPFKYLLMYVDRASETSGRTVEKEAAQNRFQID